MVTKLLIANRGEIAVRVLRAASELGIHTAAVYSRDDETSLHRRLADESHALGKSGAAAYLDADAILQAARGARCDAVHTRLRIPERERRVCRPLRGSRPHLCGAEAWVCCRCSATRRKRARWRSASVYPSCPALPAPPACPRPPISSTPCPPPAPC